MDQALRTQTGSAIEGTHARFRQGKETAGPISFVSTTVEVRAGFILLAPGRVLKTAEGSQ